jgi:hypothetical protein
MHRGGVTAAGAELVGLARSVGLAKGEWVAIDGSKSHTVSGARTVREHEALERYLHQLEQADQQDEVIIDSGGVATALEKSRQHPEPEAGFMHSSDRPPGQARPRLGIHLSRRSHEIGLWLSPQWHPRLRANSVGVAITGRRKAPGLHRRAHSRFHCNSIGRSLATHTANSSPRRPS